VSDLFFGTLAGLLLGMNIGVLICRLIYAESSEFASVLVKETCRFLLFNSLLIACIVMRAAD
jgi:hypothetical protein